MTTISELCAASVRLLRGIDTGASLGTNELSDAVQALNMWLDSLSTEPNAIYVVTRESFDLVAGDNEYTIGTGGDFNTTRPVRILQAFVRIGTTDYSVKPMNVLNYAAIPQKSISGTPRRLYYAPEYPLGKILLDYGPTSSTDDLHIYSHKAFPSYATDGSDTIALPPGYERMMKYNLAVELCPEYKGASVPALVMKTAQDSLDNIKAVNRTPIPELNTEFISGTARTGRTFDINSSEYIG